MLLQVDGLALAFYDVAAFTFKTLLAAGAGFDFVLVHFLLFIQT
jgi:hypothetical protein